MSELRKIPNIGKQTEQDLIASGDTTTWLYHVATGLELKKTYADGSFVSKTRCV